MTREDILKELELWPLWKLNEASQQTARVEMPQPLEAEADKNERQEANKALEENISVPSVQQEAAPAEVVDKSANLPLQVLETHDGDCLLVHHGASPSQDEIQIRHNIARAMRLNIKAVADIIAPVEIVESRTPKVIVLFGENVLQKVLQIPEKLEELRGLELDFEGVACIATYDMQYLLDNVHAKQKAWQDLCLALELLALE